MSSCLKGGLVVSLAHLFKFISMSKGSKLVSEAIVGDDIKTVIVAEKLYVIHPPTIYKLAGAGKYLSSLGDEQSVRDCIKSINDSEKLVYALSWFIKGDNSLYEDLSRGTFDELVDALSEAYSLISVENFTRLSILAKNVAKLIANQK